MESMPGGADDRGAALGTPLLILSVWLLGTVCPTANFLYSGSKVGS